MFTFIVSQEFECRYAELPIETKKKLTKQEALFRDNPFHPSLHTEKLVPKDRQVWSFRIDKKYRVIFRFCDHETIELLTVGPHGWIYRFPF